jgi:hypothetical protein
MATIAKPPWPTGKPPEQIYLTGCLIPWSKDNQPVLFNMPMSPHQYLALFTSETMLRTTMKQAGIDFAKIKQVGDSQEFMQSIPPEVVVIQDPWFTDEGKVRFKQLVRK